MCHTITGLKGELKKLLIPKEYIPNVLEFEIKIQKIYCFFLFAGLNRNALNESEPNQQSSCCGQ